MKIRKIPYVTIHPFLFAGLKRQDQMAFFKHGKPTLILKDIDVSHIKEVVSKALKVSVSEMEGSGRKHDFTLARQICMHIMYVRSKLTLKEIGGYFGNRDHSTVIYSNATLLDRLETDNNVRDLFKDIILKISNP